MRAPHLTALAAAAALSFCSVLVPLSSAHAAPPVPPGFTEEVNRMVDEMQKNQDGRSKDACGGYISVSYEFTVQDAEGGKTVESLPVEWRNVWGCNGVDTRKAGAQQVTSSFKHEQSAGADGSLGVFTAHVMAVTLHDTEKSVFLEGRVTDKREKGVRKGTVSARNLRSGEVTTAKTDAEGWYEMHLSSGEYEIWAETKDCKSSRARRLLCAYGPASPETAAKREKFTHDIRIDCGDLALEMTGACTMDFEVREDGVTFDGEGKNESYGVAPLSLDRESGKISGEGGVEWRLTHFVDKAVICDDGECHTIEVPGFDAPPDGKTTAVVDGTLTGETAKLTVTGVNEPMRVQFHAELDGRTVTEIDHVEPGSSDVMDEIVLPYREGAAARGKETRLDSEYGYVLCVTDYKLIKPEDAKQDPLPPPVERGGGPGGAAGGSGGGQGAGPGGGPGTGPGTGGGAGRRVSVPYQGGKATFFIPENDEDGDGLPDEEDDGEDEPVSEGEPHEWQAGEGEYAEEEPADDEAGAAVQSMIEEAISQFGGYAGDE